MESIARYYVESANPDGASLPGVPLADLTDEAFDALPKWLQLSIDASTFYRKTKPSAPAKADAPKHAAAGNG